MLQPRRSPPKIYLVNSIRLSAFCGARFTYFASPPSSNPTSLSKKYHKRLGQEWTHVTTSPFFVLGRRYGARKSICPDTF
jgi:hypothetical protein